MMLRSLGLVTFLSCLHPFIKGSFKLIKVVAEKNSLALEKKLEAPKLLGSDYSDLSAPVPRKQSTTKKKNIISKKKVPKSPRIRNRAFICSGGAQCNQGQNCHSLLLARVILG